MEDDTLLSDNLLPNDSETLYQMDTPEQQVTEVNQERSMVQGAGKQLIDHIITWFDEAIAESDSIDLLDLESNVPVESQILAAKHLNTMLSNRRGELFSLRDDHFTD